MQRAIPHKCNYKFCYIKIFIYICDRFLLRITINTNKMTFTPSQQTKENALKSLQIYLGYVRSSLKASDILTDYNLQKKGIEINSESAKIISNCLLELEILSK